MQLRSLPALYLRFTPRNLGPAASCETGHACELASARNSLYDMSLNSASHSANQLYRAFFTIAVLSTDLQPG